MKNLIKYDPKIFNILLLGTKKDVFLVKKIISYLKEFEYYCDTEVLSDCLDKVKWRMDCPSLKNFKQTREVFPMWFCNDHYQNISLPYKENTHQIAQKQNKKINKV